MTFKRLLHHLELRLGHHQVPLKGAVCDIKGLFEVCALHHELMMELLRDIYKKNGCQHLNDRVTHGATFEAITPIRVKILRAPNTDIDLFNLIEDFCLAADSFFQVEMATPTVITSNILPQILPRPSADILPFRVSRARKTKSLA